MFSKQLHMKLMEDEKTKKENFQTIENEIAFGFIKVDSNSNLLESINENKTSRKYLIDSNYKENLEKIIKDSSVLKKIDTNKSSLRENSFQKKLLSFQENSNNTSQKTKNSDFKPIKIESEYDKNETVNWESLELDNIIKKKFEDFNNEKVNPLSIIQEEEISNIGKSKFNNISSKKLSNNKSYPHEQNEKDNSNLLNSNLTKDLFSKNPNCNINSSNSEDNLIYNDKSDDDDNSIQKENFNTISKKYIEKEEEEYEIIKKNSVDKNLCIKNIEKLINKQQEEEEDETPENLSVKMEQKNGSFNLKENEEVNLIKPKFNSKFSDFSKKLENNKSIKFKVEDRLIQKGKIYNEKKNISKEIKKINEKNKYSFKPQINPKSREIVQNNKKKFNNIIDKKTKNILNKNKKNSFLLDKKYITHKANKSNLNKTNLNKTNNSIVDKNNKSFNNNYINFNNKYKSNCNYSKIKANKTNLNKTNNSILEKNKSFCTVKKNKKELKKEYSFKPSINKKSKILAQKRKNSSIINKYNSQYKNNNFAKEKKKSFVNENSNKILLEKILDNLYKILIELEILNQNSSQRESHKNKIKELLDDESVEEEESGDVKLTYEDTLNIGIAMNFILIYDNEEELTPEQNELFDLFWRKLNGDEYNYITVFQLTNFYLAIYGLSTKEIGVEGFNFEEIKEIQNKFKLFKENKRLIENKEKLLKSNKNSNISNSKIKKKNDKKNESMIKNFNQKIKEKAEFYNIKIPKGKWTIGDYQIIQKKIKDIETSIKLEEKIKKEQNECTFTPIINNSNFNDSKSNYFSNYNNSKSNFKTYNKTEKGFKNYQNSKKKNIQIEIMNNNEKEILMFNANSNIYNECLKLQKLWELTNSEFDKLYSKIKNSLIDEFN